jgi:RNA polymerase sigma-70 factor (ECF subfamily)
MAAPTQSPEVEPAMRLPPADETPAAPSPLDEAGFVAVYEAHFDYVYHSLRRLGVRDADLEDLAHDVFVVLYRGRADYDRSRPVRPWLFGIAFRVASDFRRRARHRFEVDGEGREFADAAPGALERLAAAEDKALVRFGLEALDLDRRAVFVMHDIDGHAMPEIAAALGVPLNTAYSRLRLAREQFAQVVRRRRLAETRRDRPSER